MEEDLFQLRQLPVVKFRRTGESARSEDDTASGEHEVQIEGVRAGLEAVELDDGAAVPKEFLAGGVADLGGLCRHDVQFYPLGKHLRPVRQENRAEDQCALDPVLWHPQCFRARVQLDPGAPGPGGLRDRRGPPVGDAVC
uniref:Uncharacterized protein n=1 Tax=Monodon monoceros TaxID=40151 RepID=A0A8C6CDN3_MONMO